MSDYNFWNIKLPRCPHCGENYNVWSGDNCHGMDFDDGGHTTFECEHCNQKFVAVTIVNYGFSTAVSDDAASDEEWGPCHSKGEA